MQSNVSCTYQVTRSINHQKKKSKNFSLDISIFHDHQVTPTQRCSVDKMLMTSLIALLYVTKIYSKAKERPKNKMFNKLSI